MQNYKIRPQTCDHMYQPYQQNNKISNMAHKARPNSILHIRDMSKAQFRMAKIKRVYKAEFKPNT